MSHAAHKRLDAAPSTTTQHSPTQHHHGGTDEQWQQAATLLRERGYDHPDRLLEGGPWHSLWEQARLRSAAEEALAAQRAVREEELSAITEAARGHGVDGGGIGVHSGVETNAARTTQANALREAVSAAEAEAAAKSHAVHARLDEAQLRIDALKRQGDLEAAERAAKARERLEEAERAAVEAADMAKAAYDREEEAMRNSQAYADQVHALRSRLDAFDGQGGLWGEAADKDLTALEAAIHAGKLWAAHAQELGEDALRWREVREAAEARESIMADQLDLEMYSDYNDRLRRGGGGGGGMWIRRTARAAHQANRYGLWEREEAERAGIGRLTEGWGMEPVLPPEPLMEVATVVAEEGCVMAEKEDVKVVEKVKVAEAPEGVSAAAEDEEEVKMESHQATPRAYSPNEVIVPIAVPATRPQEVVVEEEVPLDPEATATAPEASVVALGPALDPRQRRGSLN